MTSQISVANQLGVAVSSDTLSSRSESNGDTKTYPAVSKMWELGSNHNLVVLHCGSTHFGTSHFKMLISEWSRSLVEQLSTVSDYVNSFQTWVSDNAADLFFDEKYFLTEALQSEYRRFTNTFNSQLREMITQHTEGRKKTTDEEFGLALSTLFDFVITNYYTTPTYPDLTVESTIELLKKCGVSASELFKNFVFGEEKVNLPSSFNAIVEHHAASYLCRFIDADFGSELNFVGFGREDRFAQVCRLSISSYYGSKIRGSVQNFGSKDPDEYPAWNVYAQGQAITKFLHGSSVDDLTMFDESSTSAAKEVFGDQPEKLKEFRDKLATAFNDYFYRTYQLPNLRTLGALGVGSLARLAEMLVRLEALRSASLDGEATVGGFVECLTITRETGIQWHQRLSIDNHSLEDSSHVFA